jgi:hypothetical protein
MKDNKTQKNMDIFMSQAGFKPAIPVFKWP